MWKVTRSFIIERLLQQHQYIIDLIKRKDITENRKHEILESAIGVKSNLLDLLDEYK